LKNIMLVLSNFSIVFDFNSFCIILENIFKYFKD